MFRFNSIFLTSVLLGLLMPCMSPAIESTNLTLEHAVSMAMRNSYRIKQLKMSIAQSTLWLQGKEAGLKSRVYMNMKLPELNNTSDYRWNSILQRDEIIHVNTQRWESVLSVKQPIILMGYPTDGAVSLNYKIHRYLQKEHVGANADYYNRLYIHLEQPFFLPNGLKNDLESAKLDLKSVEFDYIKERVRLLREISDDFYSAFKMSYFDEIHQRHLNYLTQIHEIAIQKQAQNPEKRIERIKAELEINNVRENRLENQSKLRLAMSALKQRLRINPTDSFHIRPLLPIRRIEVDLKQAIEYGFSLNPELKQLTIRKRKAELTLDNTKGWNTFHMTLQMTYGLEKTEDHFQDIWTQYENSNSVTLNAYLPIWDWKRQKMYEEARMLEVHQRQLTIDEQEEDIRRKIINATTNLNEYQTRCLTMKNSLELAEEVVHLSISQYNNHEVSLTDLLTSVNRYAETESKFIDTYLGYKQAILELTVQTYYDFENGVSLLDEFKHFE